MKISVLGHSGFIGSQLVNKLLMAGHQLNLIAPEKYQEDKKSALYFNLDMKAMADWPSEIWDVDVVYDLMSATTPASSQIQIDKDIQLNLESRIKALTKLNKKSLHYVFISSGGTVYGESQELLKGEHHSTNPRCSYGIVKLAVEKYLQMFAYQGHFNYTILRAANPYGPWPSNKAPFGAINTFINNLVLKKDLDIIGTGETLRDYIFIEDLVEIMVRIPTAQQAFNNLFNVGTGKGSSIKDVLKIISSLSSFNSNFLPAREYDLPHSVLDIQKIKKELAWEPQVSLEEGIKKTFHWRMDALK